MENINPQPVNPVAQETQPAQVSEIPPTPARSKSKIIIVLIILFIILFFGSAAAIGMKVFSDINNEKVLIPTPTPPTTILPTQNPTADWVEFVADGFSIKHPSGWVLAQSDKTEDLYMYFSKTTPADSTNNIVTLSVQDIDIERSTNYLNTGDAGLKNSAEITHDTLNGVKIVKAVSTFSQMNPATGTYIPEPSDYVILLPLGNKTIRLSSLLKDKDMLDQILSTLKFTTPNTTLETANWKNYTNTIDRFTLKYPNDFVVDETDTKNGNISIYKIGSNDLLSEGGSEWARLIIKNENSLHPNFDKDYINAKGSQFSSTSRDIGTGNNIVLRNSNNKNLYLNCYLYNSKEDINICNQILSTFKFTN